LKSALDLILDYGAKNDFSCITHRGADHFYTDVLDVVSRTQYVFFRKASLFYLAFDSYASKAFTSRNFSVVYRSLENSDMPEFSLSKRDCLDYFLRFHQRKTGNREFDRYFTICSKSKELQQVFSGQTLELFRLVYQQIQPLQLWVKTDPIQSIPELAGKKIIGLETNQWVYEHADLDLFLLSAERLFDLIIR
jgi:hypothetical protein